LSHTTNVYFYQLKTGRNWSANFFLLEAKAALQVGDIVGQVQHGRGGFQMDGEAFVTVQLRLILCLSWRKPSTNQHEVLTSTLV